jgi:hypothetical protein
MTRTTQCIISRLLVKIITTILRKCRFLVWRLSRSICGVGRAGTWILRNVTRSISRKTSMWVARLVMVTVAMKGGLKIRSLRMRIRLLCGIRV